MKKKWIVLSGVGVAVLCVVIAAIVGGNFIKANVQLPQKEVPLSARQQAVLMMNYDTVSLTGEAPLKRVINSENPLNLLNYYGNEPILELWNSIPENQKPYTILLLIPGHTLLPGNEEALLWLEKNADMCEQNKIPYAIQNTNGEIALEERLPIGYLENRFAKKHQYFYGLNAAELYNGVEWRGEAESNNSQYIIDCINLCVKYGAYFLWTDTNRNYTSGMVLEWMQSNEAFYSAFKKNSQNICLMNKESYGDPSSYSCMQGLWLAGLVGNWGVASDWWHWQVDGDKKSLFGEFDEIVDSEWDMIVNFPENMYVQSMMMVASAGATCFKAEAPNFSTSIGGVPVGGFSYGISPLFDRFISGVIKIPTKQDVLNETRAAVLGKENYTEFNYNLAESNLYPTTGRYGIIPLLPTNLRAEEKKVFADNQIELIHTKTAETRLNVIYPAVDGNTYITRTANSWYFINNVENQRAKKYAKIAPVLSSADEVYIEAQEHTSAIITENSSDINFYLSNYRTDKKEMVKAIVKDSMVEKSWVEVCKAFLPLDEAGNPLGVKDQERRVTTIKVKASLHGGEPTVVFENPADGSGYQNRPYSYESSYETGVLTLKISHNGPVNFKVLLDKSSKTIVSIKQPTSVLPDKNGDSTESLKQLVNSIKTEGQACYNEYSYIQLCAAREKANVMIREQTYSKKQIAVAETQLKQAQTNLLDITKYTTALREAQQEKLSVKKQKAFEALLREVTSNKVYVAGRSKDIRYKPKYKEATYNVAEKQKALEKKYDAFMQA